jgi:predicted lipoprotein with Yx(FWY)xxD motif
VTIGRRNLVVPTKKIIAAAGGVLAAMALFGCAPAGSNGYGASDQPALANATSDPSAAASPSAAAPPPAAPVGNQTTELKAVTIPKMGQVVTDQKGWVLYRFDKDTAKPTSKSNCVAKCSTIWPPALSDGNPQLTGVLAANVGTVTRDDGGTQLTLGGWPLYRYIGDLKPGQWKGQNVGATWFVSAADGKKNVTCLPTPPPVAVAPPADNNAPAAAATTPAGNGY